MGISGATPTLTHVNPYPPRRVRIPTAVGKGHHIFLFIFLPHTDFISVDYTNHNTNILLHY